MWSSRIELRLINMLRDKVQKTNQKTVVPSGHRGIGPIAKYAQTGLGWDPIVGVVIALNEFWDKASKNVKKFKTKRFEYFHEMADIVEHYCATGALARASTQGGPDSDEEDDTLNKFWSPGARGSNAVDAIPIDLCGD
ncbi:hypothetical protein ACSBR2_042315 [Camellia fascicularis]